MGTEVMTPGLHAHALPFSAITIQSMADIGPGCAHPPERTQSPVDSY